jgi:hypothetical protein
MIKDGSWVILRLLYHLLSNGFELASILKKIGCSSSFLKSFSASLNYFLKVILIYLWDKDDYELTSHLRKVHFKQKEV